MPSPWFQFLVMAFPRVFGIYLMRVTHGRLIHGGWPEGHWRVTDTNRGYIDRARPAHMDGCRNISAFWIKDNGKGRGSNIIAIVRQRLVKVLLLNNPKALA